MTFESCKIGNHEAARESGNLFVYRFASGPVTAEDLARVNEFEQRSKEAGPTYNLVVFDDGMLISPGALTQATKLLREAPPLATALVVRSYSLRVSLQFMFRTLRLLGAKMEMAFFEDERVAREWILKKQQIAEHSLAEAG